MDWKFGCKAKNPMITETGRPVEFQEVVESSFIASARELFIHPIQKILEDSPNHQHHHTPINSSGLHIHPTNSSCAESSNIAQAILGTLNTDPITFQVIAFVVRLRVKYCLRLRGLDQKHIQLQQSLF